MVRMSDVWDRATDVVAGRRGILVSLVLLLIWLPGLVRNGVRLAVLGPAADATAMTIGVHALIFFGIGLLALALAVLGQLAMVAVASDPAVSRRDALRVALRRFWPYVGVMAIALVVGAFLVAPIGIALAGAYPSLAAMRAGVPPQIAPGTALFVLLYSLVLAGALLWIQARLLWVLVPVVVNERLGLGSFARAFRLTRGLTWRIVGVVLLFAVVTLVAVLATQGVVGVALRLLLGYAGMGLALFLTSAVVALVACAAQVVVAAFTAQLYVATRERLP